MAVRPRHQLRRAWTRPTLFGDVLRAEHLRHLRGLGDVVRRAWPAPQISAGNFSEFRWCVGCVAGNSDAAWLDSGSERDHFELE
jgi:hypothetical protein